MAFIKKFVNEDHDSKLYISIFFYISCSKNFSWTLQMIRLWVNQATGDPHHIRKKWRISTLIIDLIILIVTYIALGYQKQTLHILTWNSGKDEG